MNIIFVGNKRIYKRGEKVKCPNCDKEMDNKSYCKMEEFYHCGDKEIYYQKVEHKKFVCKSCKIIYLDDEWKIPEKYNPTEKQKKTILFINNRLRNINVGWISASILKKLKVLHCMMTNVVLKCKSIMV